MAGVSTVTSTKGNLCKGYATVSIRVESFWGEARGIEYQLNETFEMICTSGSFYY